MAANPNLKRNSKPLILLVDDNAVNVMIAAIFLDDFGYTYEVASNGQEAIECIKAKRYDAVIMDVRMPKMCGLSATRAIRQYEKDRNFYPVPIIAMTAQVLTGDRERCFEAGMDDYISKPFNPNEFQQKLETFTG